MGRLFLLSFTLMLAIAFWVTVIRWALGDFCE